MGSPNRVNVSAVQDFMSCRFRWWCKWVMNRTPRKEAPALTAGKLLHVIFEDYHRDGTPLALAAELRAKEFRDLASLANQDGDIANVNSAEKALKVLTDLGEGLALWEDKYPFEIPVLEIEQPFEIEFPECANTVFLGRPDRAGVSCNRVWHVQNRGLAASTNFGLYTELAQRHYHEHLYAEVLSKKYPDYEYGGTFFNLVRKLKYRTGVTKNKPLGETKTANELFFQHPMAIKMTGDTRPARVHKHVMGSLFDHVAQMQYVRDQWELYGEIPAPNEKMNGGAYGNVIDEYFKVLIGETKLNDDKLFKDREDLYASPVQEEE